MLLDFMISQNNKTKDIIIAPKKIHLATSGGMDASALILALPMTKREMAVYKSAVIVKMLFKIIINMNEYANLAGHELSRNSSISMKSNL